mmetsp:Transcript_2322/g.2431  ORF Transcript_2322/g.2431 Transcript_2322/m.2431 type:complete len:591 (-) Transcript_2322:128-1900(-)|eukprot:CAMPEP_0119051636 /NCGR_PEP_ID=MMETSP1177-20130426/73189_1 /TAXON_ID=2985 /ORGANISM="Ochromonas sp, Strain CCMP1899" /LENGTH=590 /DNA_ID=CAMNT_0007030907 /DNA_START=82 /DNA_END=1854 /DNA_ORIENTATION=-
MASSFDPFNVVIILPAQHSNDSQPRKASKEKTQLIVDKHANVLKIYEGSKSFWRSRNTLEIIIYEHLIPSSTSHQFHRNVLQIIVYDASNTNEALVMYFLSDKIYEKIKKSENFIKNSDNEKYKQDLSISDKIYEKIKQTAKSIKDFDDEKSKQSLCSMHLEGRKIIQDLMVEYIVKRISMIPINNTEYEIKLVALCNDLVEEFDLPMLRPEGLTDVDMKRKTPGADIKEAFAKKLKDVRRDTISIQKACQTAVCLADLAMESFKSFESMLEFVREKQAQKEILEKLPMPRQRWIKAIKLILLQNRVLHTTLLIDDFEKKTALKILALSMMIPIPNQDIGRLTPPPYMSLVSPLDLHLLPPQDIGDPPVLTPFRVVSPISTPLGADFFSPLGSPRMRYPDMDTDNRIKHLESDIRLKYTDPDADMKSKSLSCIGGVIPDGGIPEREGGEAKVKKHGSVSSKKQSISQGVTGGRPRGESLDILSQTEKNPHPKVRKSVSYKSYDMNNGGESPKPLNLRKSDCLRGTAIDGSVKTTMRTTFETTNDVEVAKVPLFLAPILAPGELPIKVMKGIKRNNSIRRSTSTKVTQIVE